MIEICSAPMAWRWNRSLTFGFVVVRYSAEEMAHVRHMYRIHRRRGMHAVDARLEVIVKNKRADKTIRYIPPGQRKWRHDCV